MLEGETKAQNCQTISVRKRWQHCFIGRGDQSTKLPDSVRKRWQHCFIETMHTHTHTHTHTQQSSFNNIFIYKIHSELHLAASRNYFLGNTHVCIYHGLYGFT